MKLTIAEIVVPERRGREVGDLQPLADSIQADGLAFPIVIDGQYRLISGYRRLRALRTLGRRAVETLEARSLAQAVEALLIERTDGRGRKEPSPAEAVMIGLDLERLAPKSKIDRRIADAIGQPPTVYQLAREVVLAAERDPLRFSDLVDRMRTDKDVSVAHGELLARRAAQPARPVRRTARTRQPNSNGVAKAVRELLDSAARLSLALKNRGRLSTEERRRATDLEALAARMVEQAQSLQQKS